MRAKAKLRSRKSFIQLPQGELLAWLCGGVAFLILAGWAWILKGPSSEQMVGDPSILKDYFHGFWHGWTPQYLLGRSEALLNVSFLSVWSLGFIQLLASPLVGDLGGIKIAALLFAGLSGVSMYFFLRTLTPNKKAAALGGFLYVTMPSIIVRAVMYEHVAVSLAFVFVPLLLRGLWILTQTSSPREIVLLGLSAAGLSLSYTKMAVTILPMLLVWAGFCLIQSKVPRLHIFLSYLVAGLVAFLAGLTILLPAFHESRLAALFALDPLEGWQKHYSFKTALSWVDLSKFFLTTAGPDFEGDAQYFFIGAVPLIGISLGLGLPRLANWRETLEGRWFFALLSCWVLTIWVASGPRGIFGGHMYLLSSCQGMKDYGLPLIWFLLLWMLWMVWMVMRGISRGGRVVSVLGLLLFAFFPIFIWLAKLPFFGDVRAPESFWSTAGYACLVAATALVAVPLLTRPQSEGKQWQPLLFSVFLFVYLAHLFPVYQAFGKGGLDPKVIQDFEAATEFLKSAPRQGRVHAVSSRYFYLTIPEKTTRGLSTEALLRHFQLKWVRHLEVASQGSMDLFQKYLNLAGVSYLLIDKSDSSIPPQMIEVYRQMFPLVFESNNITLLENRGSLFPAFLAHDYVSYPAQSYLSSPAMLQLSGLNFLGVENPQPETNSLGLAGISNGGEEVQLTPEYRDRTGRPFLPIPLALPRADDFGHIKLMLPTGHDEGWLAITEAWHPNWRAFINGVEKPTTRVAGAFLGVKVETGDQRIDLRFKQPAWYLIMTFIGCISWILGIIVLLVALSRWCPEGFRKWWVGDKLVFQDQKQAAKKNFVLRESPKLSAPQDIQKPLVILPTYNEVEMIHAVLDEILIKVPKVDILIVDDGSPDGTANKAKDHAAFMKRVHIMERPGKAGLGSAYRAGFNWALEKGYDAVVEMDADLSHDPADVPRLLAALSDGADMAVGSRYLNGIRILNWPQSRLLISTFGGWYARCLTGLPMTDPTSGFKAIRSKVLENLDWEKFTAQGYGFQVELHFFAWQSGFKIQEVPIVFTERRQGSSKMSPEIAKEAAVRVIQLGLRRIFP
jgi:dolichol-phosphate mannosyltransferase